MTGINIDIVKILSNMSTELSVNLVDSLSLNFLDCKDEMYIHL